MLKWLIPVVAVAPCQCFKPAGVQITSPDLISRFAPFHSCTQPVPERTISNCPAGWVCQAERAPGSNVTCPADSCVCAGSANCGSTRTEPVNVASAPLAEGREPLGKIFMPSASAGPASIASVAAAVAKSLAGLQSHSLMMHLHFPYCSSRHMLHPVHGRAVQLSWTAMWLMAVAVEAPCQCFSPGSNHTTSRSDFLNRAGIAL